MESSLLEFDLFSDIEEHSEEEETTEIMMETMKQYMSKTRGNYGSGVARPKINDKTHFKLKGKFLKELRENTFYGLKHEDTNEHIEKVLEIIDLFYIPEVTYDQIVLRAFPMSLTRVASCWLRNEPSGSITNWETLKTKFLNKYYPPARTAKKIEEINNFKQEPDESLFRAWERFKKVMMKCPQHYLTDIQEVILFYNGLDVPTRHILDSKGVIPTKTDADAKFGAPYQPRGQYRAAGLGFYQRNNRNSSYPDRRQTLEESLTKFMAESAKRHEENSNIIKEIRASTDAAIRNQGVIWSS
ncbi:gypsy/ty3 retroelement polyprotein [Tanacetum coccineum]